MTIDAHKNFAWSTVATAPSPATSGTSLVVAAGEGAAFPAVPFNATICPAGTQPTNANAEIVRVTARATDTLTITRAQEGTSARTVVVGDQVFAGVTALTLTDVETAGWASAAGTGLIDRQAYTATGAYTWNKPTGARIVRVRLVGGGQGGSAGYRGPSGTACVGGGGGAGGGFVEAFFAAADLGASVNGNVAVGGVGGAGSTSDGAAGGAGGLPTGNTDFGTILRAGNGAVAPTAGGAASGGAGGVSPLASSAGNAGGGGAASTAGGGAGAGTLHEYLQNTPPGGSAGGGVSTVPTASAGALGRAMKNVQGAVQQSGGTVPGGTPTPATVISLATLLYSTFPSYSGAGGGASAVGAGGAGGAGQGYGAGGGGGGACLNGAVSGAGGNGANGLAIVETFG